jgi:hypothetical protein
VGHPGAGPDVFAVVGGSPIPVMVVGLVDRVDMPVVPANLMVVGLVDRVDMPVVPANLVGVFGCHSGTSDARAHDGVVL